MQSNTTRKNRSVGQREERLDVKPEMEQRQDIPILVLPYAVEVTVGVTGVVCLVLEQYSLLRKQRDTY